MDKIELKQKCLDLFEKGKTISDISKSLGWSRTYIANLLKDDEKYKTIRQNRKIKVYKRKNYKQMTIHIPIEFIKGIGISENKSKNEFVNVYYDIINNQIIIRKV